MQDAANLVGLPEESRQVSDPLAGTRILQVSGADLAVTFLVFMLSVGVSWLALGRGLAMPIVLFLHLAVLCLPLGLLVTAKMRGSDLTVSSLLLLATLVGGALGAAAVGLACTALWLSRPEPARLRGWYDYIMGVVERSQSEKLFDEMRAGRTPTDNMAQVPYFTPILKGNSTDDQQRALGVIGRRFHGDFRSVLRLALRNRDGLIRAQAAAIASRLDIHEKALLWSQDQAVVNIETEHGQAPKQDKGPDAS